MGHLLGTLLPPKPGTCSECAVDHPSEQPHNAESPYYQYRFFDLHGRWPTWADAMAHCDEQVQAFWRAELAAHGVEVEPATASPEGEQ